MDDAEYVPGTSREARLRECYTICIRNEYGILDNEEATEVAIEPEWDEPEAVRERIRMSPIVIEATNIKDFAAFRRRVAKKSVSEFKIAYLNESITVNTFCRDDHKNLFRDLQLGAISVYSHRYRKDKKIIYVIKDLPRGLSIEEVQVGIREWIDFDDVNVTPMHKRNIEFEDDKYPYFVVDLPPDYDTRKLLKMKAILDFKVRWEKLP